MLDMLHLRTVLFRQYHKKYFMSNLYLLYFKCVSELNLILLFTFLSKHKALYKHNSLEHFLNKDLKTLHRHVIIN